MPSRPRKDILVLGAGVIGVATAYALARRGISVTLVDRAAAAGQGTSFANGAQLSYAYTDTLASPALLGKLPKVLLGLDPGIRLKPSLDPEFLRWGLQFLRNCTAARHEAGTLALLALAAESKLALDALLARHAIEFHHAVAGKMQLFYDASALEAARRMSDLKRRHGAEQEALNAQEAIAIEPALSDAKGLVGAIYTPGDCVGDPERFCRGLTETLVDHYGVTTAFGADIRAIAATRDGVRLTAADGRELTAKSLVVALGPQASSLLRTLGVRAPIVPMKGYSITAAPGDNAPRISLTDTSRKIVFCRLGNRIRVAGGAEVGNGDARVDPARVRGLIDSARASLPNALDAKSIAPGWAGLRPMTPDGLPIISLPRANVFLNIGQGMLGWTLAMGSAERLAGLLVGAETAEAFPSKILTH